MHIPFRLFAAVAPSDAGALLVGAAARQAMTPTALCHARLSAPASAGGRFAPADGAFAGTVAEAFTEWKQE